jgi:hypothetical protein
MAGEVAMIGRSVSRGSRTFATGMVAVVAILVAGRGGPAWYHWQSEVRQTAREVRDELARSRATLRDTALVTESLTVRSRRLSMVRFRAFTSASSGAAGAMVASLLSDAAADAGMRITSLQVHADTSKQRTYYHVTLRADMTGDITGLQQLLSSIENGPALLNLREIAIAQTQLVSTPDRPEMLRVQLNVDGLMSGARANRSR